jgi:isopentenyldiphosphate isomerase
MQKILVAQDPAERFDVVRADGTPTGRTKPRAAVHRDGDWHRSLHVWVYGRDETGTPFLLFQRRGTGKDTWPGRLDATVGGHLQAGETVDEALREIEEEIGVSAAPNSLRHLGTRVSVSEEDGKFLDRELQKVYLLRDERPLTAYRPSPAELAALVRFSLSDLLTFLGGETEQIAGVAIAPGADRASRVTITPADFIPAVDRYFYRVAIATAAVSRGERHVAI